MPIDDAVGEAVGFIVRQAGGLVVDLSVEHVFPATPRDSSMASDAG